MTLSKFALAFAAVATLGTSVAAFATDSKPVAEVKEAGRDIKKESKKGARAVKDETCKMIHGKMECAAKKAGHKMENAADEVKEKANEPAK
jgi:uncharacterized protein YoxC